MSFLRRYARTSTIALGTQFGTSTAIPIIRENVRSGNIPSVEYVVQERMRLDTIAGKVYGDAKLWWVISAASNCGWGLQVPPGTLLRIPDIAAVARMIG